MTEIDEPCLTSEAMKRIDVLAMRFDLELTDLACEIALKEGRAADPDDVDAAFHVVTESDMKHLLKTTASER